MTTASIGGCGQTGCVTNLQTFADRSWHTIFESCGSGGGSTGVPVSVAFTDVALSDWHL